MKNIYGGKLKAGVQEPGITVKKGTWLSGNLIFDEETGGYYIHLVGNRRQKFVGLDVFIAHEVDSDSVVAWTGKNDVNGKYIFSGSVVKVQRMTGEEETGVIIPYASGAYGIKTLGTDGRGVIEDLNGDGNGARDDYWGIEGLEVVGHVLDMPEVWNSVGGKEEIL